MCVWNAVLSAWTTLEMACRDALGISELKSDFKRSLDDEFAAKGLTRLDFAAGLWQKINSQIKGYRKIFTHTGGDIMNRFPPLSVAEEAIKTIRQAIQKIYAKTGKSLSPWVVSANPMDEVMDQVEHILGSLNVPFTGIRVYRGSDLLLDENFEMR
jgi:hypothetical protein